ncbi:hypothetical protein PABG_00719 [Paracoccidioides brasiliensis Pb03]|nr:hypothetical protein PABG_00719 [Paracoccidioides brasiliensis Pb03]
MTPSTAPSTTPTHYLILNLPYPPPQPLPKPAVKLAYHRALLKHHPDKARAATSTSLSKPALTTCASNIANSGPQCTNRTAQAASSVAATAPVDDANGKDIPYDLHRYTVDQITRAYKILSDPVARAEYDRSLRLLGINGSRYGHGHCGSDGDDTDFRTGMEVFDLDDMEIGNVLGSDTGTGDSGGGMWYHACRCGEEKGFLVLEEDLEREAEEGEVVVGCCGCSLWAKIVFAVEDGGDELVMDEAGDGSGDGSGNENGNNICAARTSLSYGIRQYRDINTQSNEKQTRNMGKFLALALMEHPDEFKMVYDTSLSSIYARSCSSAANSLTVARKDPLSQ